MHTQDYASGCGINKREIAFLEDFFVVVVVKLIITKTKKKHIICYSLPFLFIVILSKLETTILISLYSLNNTYSS